jgi:hypothetical protein
MVIDDHEIRNQEACAPLIRYDQEEGKDRKFK